MDFELTRKENDERLLSQIGSIRSAENIQALIPFAKAYLGLFYVIDSALDAQEKVKLLANNELAAAVLDGFKASLLRVDIPSVESIGCAMAERKEFPEGYVILAGLDVIATESIKDVINLDITIMESAVGFHFSNKINCRNSWFDFLLAQHKNKVIAALSKYWIAMLDNNATYLPGRNLVFSETPDIDVIQHSILPLLEHWQNIKVKTLFQLLQLAFEYSDAEEFLFVCGRVLSHDELLNEKTRLYWIATAYLLSPDEYSARLTAYVGRVKLKTMPLLDFITGILANHKKINIEFSDKMVIQLLRMIAPVFPPQQHVYGAIGSLDINSRNVMLMFHHLAYSNEKNVINDIKGLRKARVMKIYSGVIDNLLELHLRKKNEKDFLLPTFDAYVESLVKNNKLDGRSNKFDLR